ncbi:glycosyltransferase family 2 protein [bacterium]|nr:glycosyltransferase family 2 protein [bacterium]
MDICSSANLLKGNNKLNTDVSDVSYNIEQYKLRNEVVNPKISIIVPAYNVRQYIERCMHYLLLQTLEDIEIIIVNDGSTDDTMVPVEKLAKIDKRIKIINQHNMLQGAARNNGLKYAKGEYIGFCDSDDYIDLNYYEQMYKLAKKNDADVALAENVRVSKTKYKRRLNITTEAVYEDIMNKFKVCNQNKNECPTNKIYRKSYIDKYNIRFTEGVYCEDKLFSIQAVYYANKIVTVPDVHYYYWENPKSTVNSRKTKKHKQDRIAAKRAVLDFVKEKKIPVENWYFKAEKERYSIFGIPMLIIKASTKSEKWYLFGVIPFLEKGIKE